MNENELQKAFSRVRMGDSEAFVQIYRDLSSPIFTVVFRIVRQREMAEDVTQDIFVKLFTSPPDTSVVNLRAWIFRLSRNLAIDHLRKQHTDRWDEGPAEELCAEDEMHQTTLQVDVARAMLCLTEREREIVALHIHGELGFAEIGRMEGLSLTATYRIYRRALKRLRENLEGYV